MCQDELGPERMVRGLYWKKNLNGNSLAMRPTDEAPEFICWTDEPEKLVQAALADKTPNLIGSKLRVESMNLESVNQEMGEEQVFQEHAPVLDFDFPCRLVPSSTQGKFHFYIDMPVWKYAELLKALEKADLIQPGFIAQQKKYGQTFLRFNTTKQKEGEF